MKIKGFRLKKHIVRFSRWIFYRTKRHRGHSLLEAPPRSSPKPISKLLSWAGRLTVKTKKSLCSVKPGLVSGYVPIGHEPAAKVNTVSVPRGHLAVYVGQKDGDFVRILVPVIYFNHPLFGELLREAEEEYGFNHQGGITIPCGVSEFERVKTRIATGRCGGGGFHSRESSWKWRY